MKPSEWSKLELTVSIRKLPLEKWLSRKLIQTGAAGSPHALGHIIKYLTKAEAANAEIIERDVATGQRIKAQALALLETAKAAGKDLKFCVPHPDDIIVTENVGWEIKGPADQQELAALLKRCADRDLFMAQGYLEERLSTPEEWRNAGDVIELQPGANARVMANLIDLKLPERFQLTLYDHMVIDRKYGRMTKRELLKYMSEAWRNAGHFAFDQAGDFRHKQVPRGARLPSLAYIKHMMGTFKATITLINYRQSSGRPMRLSEIADELRELLSNAPAPFGHIADRVCPNMG
jgi:hypothetical protein